ncbi:MarR family winged helix-turn-helix transcriptional regulator [Laceyella putida]|uniref:MarR family winged helix-turn-helix transcriptional regulator n=1 Tax=Laceyella putida TaxID=110101 RepID=A0ABW2RKT2_9BACL
MDNNQLITMTETFRTQLSTLIRLSKALLEQQLTRYGVAITARQFTILVQLDKKPLTIKQLGEVFSIEPPSLIPIIDTLERHELVNRVQDKQDRRKKNVELTDKGAQLIQHMHQHIDQNPIAIAFATMGAAKSRQLNELLAELVHHLQVEHQRQHD